MTGWIYKLFEDCLQKDNPVKHWIYYTNQIAPGAII